MKFLRKRESARDDVTASQPVGSPSGPPTFDQGSAAFTPGPSAFDPAATVAGDDFMERLGGLDAFIGGDAGGQVEGWDPGPAATLVSDPFVPLDADDEPWVRPDVDPSEDFLSRLGDIDSFIGADTAAVARLPLSWNTVVGNTPIADRAPSALQIKLAAAEEERARLSQ